MNPIIISKSGTAVAFPEDDAIAKAFTTKPVTIKGSPYLATAYTPKVCKLLRAMSVSVRSPFHMQYEWPKTFKPFEAQRVTAEMLTLNTRAYCLNDMGTGKTIAALAAADWLLRKREIERVLIVSPLSTLSLVWAREIFFFCPWHKAAILHGNREKRFKLLADKQYTFYIINHDAVHIIADKLAHRPDVGLVIIDELAEFRNQKRRKWAAVNTVVSFCKLAWGLTGAVRPNAPTDVWAQARLLTPHTVPPFFSRFRDQTMKQVSQFKWVERDEANDVIYKALQPSVRFPREQCVDLPPLTFSYRSVKMSKPATAAYKLMLDHLRIDVASGAITAANAGIKLGKLLQIACGWVYDDKRNIISVDATHRLNVLNECISESNTKVLVFIPFIHALQAVLDEVRLTGVTADLVYGKTSRTARTEIFENFKYAKDPHVLICYPKTMAHGLNFEHAATTIWFSPLSSYAIYEQANGRIVRPGQKNSMHIIQLVGTPAEQQVYQKLRMRESAQSILLSLFD